MFSLMLRISNIWYLCEKSNLRYSWFYSELNLMLMLKLVNIKDLALIFKEPSPHKSFSSSCSMCKELQKNTQAKRIFWMKTLKYSSRTDSTDFDNSRESYCQRILSFIHHEIHMVITVCKHCFWKIMQNSTALYLRVSVSPVSCGWLVFGVYCFVALITVKLF